MWGGRCRFPAWLDLQGGLPFLLHSASTLPTSTPVGITTSRKRQQLTPPRFRQGVHPAFVPRTFPGSRRTALQDPAGWPGVTVRGSTGVGTENGADGPADKMQAVCRVSRDLPRLSSAWISGTPVITYRVFYVTSLPAAWIVRRVPAFRCRYGRAGMPRGGSRRMIIPALAALESRDRRPPAGIAGNLWCCG